MTVRVWRSGTQVSKPVVIPSVPYSIIVPLLVVAMLAPCLFATGCNSMDKTVNVYTEQVAKIIDRISIQLNELREYWTLPLKDQAGVTDTLDKYSKAVDRLQSLLDHVDSPVPCRDLEKMLSNIAEKAESITGMTTQFSDYISDMSKVATDIDELVSELKVFQEKFDFPAGARQMYEKANSINADVKSEVPPPLFQGIQVEFTDFMGEFADKFFKAYERSNSWKDEESTESSEESEESTEEETKPRNNYRNRALEPFYEDLPDEWIEFNAQLNEWMAAAREIGGLNAANAEIDQMILQAIAEIKKLEKEYPK